MLTTPGPIAVVAPAHSFDPERLAEGLRLAREAGFDLAPFPDLLQPHRYFAATDDHRAAQLIEALTADGYSAVWAVRGGSGLTRLLPRLEGLRLRADRPVIGFSDVTALFCALHRQGAGPLLHGPVVHSLPETDPGDREALWQALRGEPAAPLTGTVWAPGAAEGWLCGGNLCLLAAMCGTPWQLDARGSVLVLEEIGELPYRIDRAVQQLVSAGQFDGVAAVALGQLSGCAPPPHAGWTLRDIFLEHLAPFGIPVLAELPIGHGDRNRPFPWGASARVEGGTLSWQAAGPMRIS